MPGRSVGEADAVPVLYINHVGAVSGAEMGLLDIVRALDRNRFSPLAAVPPIPDRLAARLEAERVPVRPIPCRRVLRSLRPVALISCSAALLRVSRRLLNVVRRDRIALIHANGNQAHLYGMFAARLARVPIVWHSRDLVSLGCLARPMARCASRVIAISATVADHLRCSVSRPGKLLVIPNGIEAGRYTTAERRQIVRRSWGADDDTAVFASIGQLVPWKNVSFFLSVAARIVDRHPNSLFLIVGEDLFGDHPRYRRELERLAAVPALYGKVRFTGFSEDIAGVLSGIDVLVHCARREPFGRILIEAMAAARPVVAAADAGPAEIIRHARDGFLFAGDDPEVVADVALRPVLNPALREAIGAAAASRVRRDFCLTRRIRQIEDVYTDILG